MTGNILFMIASLLCGAATSGPFVFAARALQGIGAAFVITGGISLLASSYPASEDRARAFGLMGVISGVAMAIGPTLGGLIASCVGWKWIFLANIPLCLITLLAAPVLVAETSDTEGRSLDWAGVALLTAALGTVIESLLVGGDAPLRMLGGFVVSAGITVIYALQQRRRPAPLFDPAVFARPAMMGIGALLLAVSIAYWSILVYLPMFLAVTFAWTGMTVGLSMLAATLPMLVLPPFGARLVAFWGWRRLFAVATAALLTGNVVLAASASGALAPSLLLPCAVIGMSCLGLGVALAHPQLSAAIVALVPAQQSGMASAVTVVLRQGGFAIGIALIGALMALPGHTTDYVVPFLVAAAVAAMGLAAAVWLLPMAKPT